jgi:4-hydroxyproline epimerase
LRTRINEKYTFVHPENPTINTCTHILWAGKTISPEATARNAVFYGDKAIDRSPCGTGTSARMAQWHAKGKLKKGDQFIHESIIGSQFIGTVEDEVTLAANPPLSPA